VPHRPSHHIWLRCRFSLSATILPYATALPSSSVFHTPLTYNSPHSLLHVSFSTHVGTLPLLYQTVLRHFVNYFLSHVHSRSVLWFLDHLQTSHELDGSRRVWKMGWGRLDFLSQERCALARLRPLFPASHSSLEKLWPPLAQRENPHRLYLSQTKQLYHRNLRTKGPSTLLVLVLQPIHTTSKYTDPHAPKPGEQLK
jgi:hypothetical protein